jgi:hypothetical protein
VVQDASFAAASALCLGQLGADRKVGSSLSSPKNMKSPLTKGTQCIGPHAPLSQAKAQSPPSRSSLSHAHDISMLFGSYDG